VEDITMTELRTRMIEDMQLAGHSQGTQAAYVRVVRQLAAHYRLSPDRLTERQVRDYLMHLREVRKVAKGTFQAHFFGIKFFFVNTLGCEWPLLTKKKSANPTANACPTFEAMRTAAA
jgi:integrase/recombinase XerD